jgi:hypothetical protein
MNQSEAIRYVRDASPSVRAATKLLAEIERARSERNATDGLIKRLGDTLKLLLGDLPPDVREDYRRRLAGVREIGQRPDNRAGEIYSNVVELFRREGRREWSVSEVQDALGDDEKQPDPKTIKAIYNALNYLAKTGRLQRISRGRYLVLGVGAAVDFAEDFGDQSTTRMTEHDT